LVLKRQRGRADAYLHIDGRDIEQPAELALKFDGEAARWAIVGDAQEYRMSEGRREISCILGNADEPLDPKEITEILKGRGYHVSYGAVREMLSQMVKDGQAKNLGRGAYVYPDYLQNNPDNPDKLTKQPEVVSLSGMSGQFSGKGDAQSCIHEVPGGCWLCNRAEGEGAE
jgi:hypothetical protein